MARILGLDYGRRRIGIAVSDPMGLIAQPVKTLSILTWEDAVEEISALVEKFEADRIVLGLPLTLRGEIGEMAKEVKRFGETVSRVIDIPILFWDERLTSVQAQRIIIDMNGKIGRKKEKIDRMASVLMLQNYLDYQRMKE